MDAAPFCLYTLRQGAFIGTLLLTLLQPNARHELLLKAGATQERTLEAVSSMPLLGAMRTVWDSYSPYKNTTAPARDR
jgi:hypothetical protein